MIESKIDKDDISEELVVLAPIAFDAPARCCGWPIHRITRAAICETLLAIRSIPALADCPAQTLAWNREDWGVGYAGMMSWDEYELLAAEEGELEEDYILRCLEWLGYTGPIPPPPQPISSGWSATIGAAPRRCEAKTHRQ